ncbi:hypothetical protein IW262DRAFT_1300440 [Armillaria fumosa]|nr:hypothetical protein IW262DRAFT_1300440 [Armillaria fumosa]
MKRSRSSWALLYGSGVWMRVGQTFQNSTSSGPVPVGWCSGLSGNPRSGGFGNDHRSGQCPGVLLGSGFPLSISPRALRSSTIRGLISGFFSLSGAGGFWQPLALSGASPSAPPPAPARSQLVLGLGGLLGSWTWLVSMAWVGGKSGSGWGFGWYSSISGMAYWG